jgi:enoyl-CoA hydratase
MSYEFTCVRFERHAGDLPGADVLEVVIDRTDSRLNAVNGQLHEELTHLFPMLQSERDARAVLLTGTGPAFSAGGDFGWFPELADRTVLERLRIDAKNLVYDLLDVHLPIVCALNGHAMGLGASVALLCDVIFMARSATIGDPHVKVGIVAGDGGTIAWPLAVGPARAKQYLLTGDPVTADEAERIGLVNFVVEDGKLHAAALDFAKRLAAGAPLAVQYTKAAVNAAVKGAAVQAFDQAAAFEIATFGTADHREALDALREKRAPRFEGR